MAPLTPEQLLAIATLVRGLHAALAVDLYGAAAVAPETLASIVALGLITEAEAAVVGDGVLGGAYGAGVARGGSGAFPPAPGAPETAPLAPRAPLPAWQQLMAQAARQHGAAMVVGLGNRVADDMTTEAIEVDQEFAGRMRLAIGEAVASSIEDAQTWGQARGRIGEALGEDWARDLGRIAATETQNAVNRGYADALLGDFGPGALCAVIPQPDACPVCMASYTKGGMPRIFRLVDLPPPEVNFKKKAKDRVTTRPPHHPWCHCQLVHVPAGWAFDEDWNLIPAPGGQP